MKEVWRTIKVKDSYRAILYLGCFHTAKEASKVVEKWRKIYVSQQV